MAKQRRNRAKVLTDEVLKRLNAQIRQHEYDENGAVKYSLEKLGELTGLDPETVGKVLSRQGNDKRVLDRCCNAFGITLTKEDYIPVSQATPPEIDPSFVGREEAIADLRELVKRNTKIIVIQARGGVGKTTLARRFLSQEFDSVLEFPIAKETKDIASIESLLEEKLRQLGEEPGREFIVSCDRLKRKLQNDRIGILIDNLEPALDSAGRFIEPHRRYVEVLRILADPSVQSITLITTRERLREASITVQTYLLKSLDVAAWKEFFESRSSTTDTPGLAALHNAYGGNAKAMEIISGAVAEDFEGDVDEYWQENQEDLFIERDLEDLVKQQFERLQEQNSNAYNLLCRMGCYRYQDVPTVPIEGLFCLMWDVPEREHKRVVKVLRDRSMIENSSDSEYFLHPIIRTESISRLREDTIWRQANEKSAIYWMRSTKKLLKVEDALKIFEAFYHYLSIDALDKAVNVISIRKLSERNKETSLGTFFYRASLYEQLSSAISIILERNHLQVSPYNMSWLHHLIGNVNWGKGNIIAAIKHQNIARENLDHYTSREIKTEEENVPSSTQIMYKYALSFFTTGIYYTYLWELEIAENFFYQARNMAEDKGLNSRPLKADKDLNSRPLKAEAFLSFTKAQMGQFEEASQLADSAYSKILSQEFGEVLDFSFYLWILGKTYKTLGKLDKSLEAYQIAISDAMYKFFSQGEARVISGIAEIDCANKRYEEAVSKHERAINILQSIGANCDLPEVFFQLGLSYKYMNREDESQFNLQEAIRLFELMQAPKQIQRVLQYI